MTAPCRSGRHLLDDDDRNPHTGHRFCRACHAEERWWRELLRPGGSARWAHPVVDQARHEAFERWARYLPMSIWMIRLTEGHDGDQPWQALGEYLHPDTDQPVSTRRTA